MLSFVSVFVFVVMPTNLRLVINGGNWTHELISMALQLHTVVRA